LTDLVLYKICGRGHEKRGVGVKHISVLLSLSRKGGSRVGERPNYYLFRGIFGELLSFGDKYLLEEQWRN
jgi:hypothetical protein